MAKKKPLPATPTITPEPSVLRSGGINQSEWKVIKHTHATEKTWEEEKQKTLNYVAKSIQEQNWVLFKQLLRGGAPVHVLWTSPDNKKMTMLAYAASLGRDFAVEALLKKGVDPDGRYGEEGETALYFSVQNRFTQCINLLLQGGAQAARKVHGVPHITVAVQKSYIEGVRLLLEWRANPNALDNEKKTPLWHNLTKQPPTGEDVEIGKLLLERGANPDRLDNHGTNARNLEIQASQSALLDHNELRRQAQPSIDKPETTPVKKPSMRI